MTKRRAMLVLQVALATASLALLGCGGDSAENEQAAGGGDTVSFASFGGELQAAEQQAFTNPFSERTGVEVVQDATDFAKVRAQVDAGNVSYDLFHATGYFVAGNCGTFFEPTSDAVDLSAIAPEYKISDCGVPVTQVAVMLVYNKEKYADDPPRSWADFFDTRKYPGKRGLGSSASMFGQLEAALLADGVSPEDLYPLDVDRALEKLDTIKDDAVFYKEISQSTEQMLSEAWDMGIVFNGRAYAAAEAGAPYEPVWNQAIRDVNNVALVKGSPHPGPAKELLNYIATPEPQEALAEIIPYAPTTPDSDPKVDDLMAKYLPTTPANLEQTLLVDIEYYAENVDMITDRFVAWTSG